MEVEAAHVGAVVVMEVHSHGLHPRVIRVTRVVYVASVDLQNNVYTG